MKISKNFPLITALAAALYAQPLYAQPQAESLCHPREGIFFSCVLKDENIVSLCTSPDSVPIESIEFRFGTRDEIKASYLSSTKNNIRFSANVLPANPKASVRHVWFDVNGSRYIVTECVGARCLHEGGVIFDHRDRVDYIQACNSSERNQVWFRSNIFSFGSGNSEDAMSYTELIRLDDDWNEINVLYPPQMTD